MYIIYKNVDATPLLICNFLTLNSLFTVMFDFFLLYSLFLRHIFNIAVKTAKVDVIVVRLKKKKKKIQVRNCEESDCKQKKRM